MNKIIEIKNLKFKYEDVIFNEFSIDIIKGDFIALIGMNGSGKSSLLKILNGEVKYYGNVNLGGSITYIDDKIINMDNEVAYILKSSNLDLINYFDIKEILYFNYNTLSENQKILVKLVLKLSVDTDIILIDDIYSKLTLKYKEKLFKYLKKENKNNKTIIYVTKDIEDSLISKNIIVLNGGKVEFYGKSDILYKNENLLKSNNLELPFMISLSNKLKYYGLVDKVILNMKKMVDIIWK
ncbi:MAG: ATP-binding cassette domain-containing protein [Bacilli bacterium]